MFVDISSPRLSCWNHLTTGLLANWSSHEQWVV